MDSFPSITVDLYALAYWLQAWSEATAHKAQEESYGK